MTFDSGTWWIASTIFALMLGGFTYLTKVALFNRIEKMEKSIDKFREDLVSEKEYDSDIKEIKENIEIIKANYTPKRVHEKDFDECRCEIKKITESYLTKEDFLREQAKTERKLDKVLDILLEINNKNERC